MVTKLTGKHVLLGLIGFFGVIFAVNGAFIYYAVESWTGLDIDNSFIHGLSFEEDIQEAHEWKVEIDPKDLGNDVVRLNVIIERIDGKSSVPDSIDAEVRRPAVANYDQDIELTRTGARHYVGEVHVAGRGIWQVRVRGRDQSKAVLFRADKRLFLKP
jgi:nitrogen fixation protein FixH